MKSATFLVILSSLFPAESQPQWSRWRGPDGTGHSSEKGFPTEWDPSAVVWKTELKGEGQSSPVVWEDRIFLTSAMDDGKKRLVFGIDRSSGKVLWEQVAWTGEPEPTHRLNGWASPTCATDGERVYASFGKAGLHCYTVEGKHVWSAQLGEFLSQRKRGTAASPVLVDNLVILNGDSDSDPFLFGVDKMTGKVVWKTKRPATEGYSTPVIVAVDGHKEIVLNGHFFIAGYDPATGKELWTCKSFTGRGEPTPTLANGILYVVNGQPGDIYAVRPGGSGDVTQSHMVWHTQRKSGRDQPSPIVVNGFLIVSNIAGMATCYDAATGKQLWHERVSNKEIMGSPVAVDGKVYFLNTAGETIVIEPAQEPRVVARNKVTTSDEVFRSSLAPYRGQFFVRSQTTLYCVGKK